MDGQIIYIKPISQTTHVSKYLRQGSQKYNRMKKKYIKFKLQLYYKRYKLVTLNLFQQGHPDDRNQSRGKTQSHISINKFQSRISRYVDCYKLSLYKHNKIFICDIESLTLGH